MPTTNEAGTATASEEASAAGTGTPVTTGQDGGTASAASIAESDEVKAYGEEGAAGTPITTGGDGDQ